MVATLGLPHAQIKQLTAQSVADAPASGVLVVGPRRKGHGAPGRAIPLSPEGKVALETFARLEAFGGFSASSMRTRFRVAAKKVGLTDVTQYDLRHTVGTELHRATSDLRTVGRLLGHTDLRTTERYAAAALLEADQAAMDALPKVLPEPEPANVELPKRKFRLAKGRRAG